MTFATVPVPGDKSVATRALLLALFADGPCTVRGAPQSRTTERVKDVVRALGGVVDVAVSDRVGGADITVVPPQRLTDGVTISCGGSATLARIILGVLAGAGVDAVVDGSAMLRARPMDRVARPLNAWFGREVVTLTDGRLPARIHKGPPPTTSTTSTPSTSTTSAMPSAQVRSALTYAAIAARVPFPLAVDHEGPWRQHLEELCEALDIDAAAPRVRAFAVDVPGDPSAAAFLQAVAAARAGAWLSIPRVYGRRGRTGFLRALAAMGVAVRSSPSIIGGESIDGLFDVVVEGSDPGALRGIVLAPGPIPKAALTPGPHVLAGELWTLIDELPILATVCALATSPSHLAGLGELRVKESDRVARTAEMLQAFGAAVVEAGDDLIIEPAPLRAPVRAIRTDHDHRIAMSALTLGAILGLGAHDVELDDEACVDESWPGFRAALAETVSRLHRGGEENT